MIVIVRDDEGVIVAGVSIRKRDNYYSYTVHTESQGIEHEGELYYHSDDPLELLEKILHGRNMSSKDIT